MMLKLYVLARYILFSLIIIGLNEVNAQKREDLHKQSSSLDVLAINLLSETKLFDIEYYDQNILKTLFEPPTDDNALNLFNITKHRQAEISRLKNDLGLSFEAGFLTNFNSTYLDDDDYLYNRRWQSGLSWDLLKDGLFDHRQQAKAETIRQSKLMFSAGQELKKYHYDYTYDLIIKIFNNLKSEIQEKRLKLLREEISLAQLMQNEKLILTDEVLSIKSEEVTTQVLYENYKTYQQHVNLPHEFSQIHFQRLPVFDLSIEPLLNDALSQANEMKDVVKKFAAMSTHPISERVGLKAFFRYSAFNEDQAIGVDRDYYTAGVTLKVPLPLQLATYKDLSKFEQQKKITQIEQHFANLQNEVLNSYSEFKFHLKQFASLYYKQLITVDNIDRELAKKQLTELDYSPVSIAKKVDHLFDIQIEILEVMQLLYLKTLKINSYLSQSNIANYSLPFTVNSNSQDRLVNTAFLNTEFTKSLNHEVILRHLKQNKIEHLIIKEDSEGVGTTQFSTAKASIKVTTLVNIPSWLTLPENKIIEEIGKLDNGSYCFDSEPMLPADLNTSWWEQRILFVLESLNLKGSSSIILPLWASQEVINRTIEVSDKIFIRVYGNPELPYLASKLSALNKEDRQKCSLLVQGHAFHQWQDLEDFAIKVKEQLGIPHTAIYEFDTWIKQLINTIGQNEKH